MCKHYLTLTGPVSFSRRVFVAATKADKERLGALGYPGTVAPLDMALGIDKIPGKMSLPLMLETAYWAQNQGSYQEAEDQIRRTLRLDVGDDTVRKVANLIGAILFMHDRMRANEAYAMLYIEMDGAAFNTRNPGQNDSTWRENKLGIVFSSDDVHVLGCEDGGIARRLWDVPPHRRHQRRRDLDTEPQG